MSPPTVRRNTQPWNLARRLIIFVIDWTIRIAALIIIPRDRKPTAAMAWLLAIFLIPIIGVFLFLLIGSYKLPKARLEKQSTSTA